MKSENFKKCKKCGDFMMLCNDRNFIFKGNCDNFWYCGHCHISCIEKIRFCKLIKEIWYSEMR